MSMWTAAAPRPRLPRLVGVSALCDRCGICACARQHAKADHGRFGVFDSQRRPRADCAAGGCGWVCAAAEAAPSSQWAARNDLYFLSLWR